MFKIQIKVNYMIRKQSALGYKITVTILWIVLITSFVMAISTKHSYANDQGVSVRLEIGEGHEELAAAMTESPQDWLSLKFSVWDDETEETKTVEVKSAQLEGSSIIINLPSSDVYCSNIIWQLLPCLNKAMVLYAEGYGHQTRAEYYFDNGEGIFCPDDRYYWDLFNQSTMGLKPMLEYEDYYEFSNERRTGYGEKVEDNQSIYLLWRKPIETMDIEIDIPQCGEEVTLDKSEIYNIIPDNQPSVTCPEHVYLAQYGNNVNNQIDHTYWATDFSIGFNRIANPYEGTLTGGNKYLAAAYLFADWGYCFAGDVEATVNGEKAEKESRRSPIWIGEYELYKYIEPEHSYNDEWTVKKEPTCTAEGLEVCHCTACGAEKTRNLDSEPDAHEWGAWKVTKQPTGGSAGEKQRVCKHNALHIEKATIAKLPISGVLIAQMTSKGSKAMNLAWTKVNNAEGYDVFFARCDHSGKNISCKKVKSIKGNKTFKWTKTGLRKNTSYKAYVKAYVMKNGKKTYVRTSPLIHAYTSGGDKEYTNPKRVMVKKSTVSLKKGKTYKIKGTVTLLNRKKRIIASNHAPKLRYLSSNKTIASVSSSGKVTAKNKGSCTIYVYAANGVRKAVKVTVN